MNFLFKPNLSNLQCLGVLVVLVLKWLGVFAVVFYIIFGKTYDEDSFKLIIEGLYDLLVFLDLLDFRDFLE